MRSLFRTLVTVVSGVSSLYFVFWVGGALLLFVHAPVWLSSVMTIVAAAAVSRYVWRHTASLQPGLVNSVVPAAQLDAEVRQWADEMLSLSPTVLKVVKTSFDDHWKPLRDRQIPDNFLEEINPGFFDSGEQQEGATAFLDKRKPDCSPWR